MMTNITSRTLQAPRPWLALHVILLCLCCEALADEGVNFTGSWHVPTSEATAFSLDLTQTGTRIKGYHIAVTPHGRRIDAALPEEGPPSITGIVKGSVAHVRFQSAYDESGHGEAVLTLRGNKLDWKITKSAGTHYLPMSSVLDRRKKHETKSPHHAMQRSPSRASPALHT